MTSRTSPWLSFLDALRPEPGWTTDLALLATYSADCATIVATMLALTGRDDDRGSGSKVDFVEAFEQLKGRFFVLLQAGRLAVPGRRLPVLRLLDRVIVPVLTDERERSWHPKLALLRLQAKEGKAVQWRLWISSRNLTRDQSLDIGLLFVSAAESRQGTVIAGVETVAQRLLRQTPHAREDVTRWCNELLGMRWHTPDGVTPLSINLFQPEDTRGYPALPEDLDELVVISPFVDALALKHFGNTGPRKAKRCLVSRLPDLRRLAATDNEALKGYEQLLQFESPPARPGDPGAAASNPMPSEAQGDDQVDEEQQPVGLHAKLLLARSGNAWRVWLGSANATERGWHRNYELVVQLDCSRRMGNALVEQAQTGLVFDPAQHAGPSPETDAVERQLESQRARLVAEWLPKLRYLVCNGELAASTMPPLDAEIQLQVGWLGGTRQDWPAKQYRLHLPAGVDEGNTELFEFCLCLDGLRSEWMQRVPWDAALPRDRDLRVISRFLDHRSFMAWLRDQLTAEQVTGGGGDWNTPPEHSHKSRRHSGAATGAFWMPTLEEVLRASVQRPEALVVVDRKLRGYFAHLPDDIPQEDAKALKEFVSMWQLVRHELMEPSR